MDKRMGWNLDSREHATFNWIRPIPAYSKVGSQFHPTPIPGLDTARIMAGPTNPMRVFKRRFVFRLSVVLLIFFWATALGPEPPARISISPSELVRAVTIQRDSLVELCLIDAQQPDCDEALGDLRAVRARERSTLSQCGLQQPIGFRKVSKLSVDATERPIHRDLH